MLLIKEFEFDAAHNLIHYHGKCERLHGHTYKLVIKLEGEPDHEGMIFDFVELKRIVKERIIDKFDHAYLNDIISQPTAENIAIFVYKELKDVLKRDNCRLYEVEVWETKTSGVAYRG
ncbi:MULTISPECIES: 6-carboxytetrahydropterin synthase QueD [Caloramator]|uniref:6-carboxy-5,6,7,8-tetrahydropterin synthase n=1 Tax=Caloramator australicus RC3 TaxID=857293 RepID=I7J5C2_9CLOT|nr:MULTISPECIES: 6-carboxytetrahydropterin synthase QueD [Caloramator]WDU83670.1 6-carboxytetrahydropterin synthase QueD [Caloramator sp. Dgby_cultured_2]CCJ33641.1 Queuosine biosynthesis QueD, PTPS-I / Folate biosynthesis protein PTPS-III, catalyzes a reaction that bypasses dihydroneopterin aldolase (FolB) [Caloramator australicus RC3]